ncbi:MAG: glycosyltransferase family 4 protein, partial [Candidatus Aenigmatarchaeota archaeon]
MFGWEFPPHSVGGLGNVTYNLTNSLADLGVKITLFLPVKGESETLRIVSTGISVSNVDAAFMPYMSESEYSQSIMDERMKCCPDNTKTGGNLSINPLALKGNAMLYCGDLFAELERFARVCGGLIKNEEFDVIHCHDWLTFRAGVLAKEISGKPLIFHVHTTELDRSCGGRNQRAYDIEKECFGKADRIIAVSNYTKNKIVKGYGIDPNKIDVVYNAITFNGQRKNKPWNNKKIVLYFGRISLHKGPDYFIKAAKKVLEYENNVVFVVAGGGELLPKMIELACFLGIGDKVLFTGKLSDEEVEKIYEAADIYVMPSVSEPFGITALEAASHGTPIIISKNSGAKEVLRHCLEVDFWDTDEMANKILSILKYPPLQKEMAANAY